MSYFDLGGDIGIKAKELFILKNRGERVIIRGVCASSCTMSLWSEVLKCVAPNASLGFHGATQTDLGKRLGNTAEMGTNAMASFYPVVFHNFIRPNMNAPYPVTWLTGKQVNSIDPSIKLCDN